MAIEVAAEAEATFGPFRIDFAKRTLWKEAEIVTLPSRAFDCLAYLVLHRDRAVGRDELLSEIWGPVEIAENILDQAVLRVRRALDDVPSNPRFIRTIHRFGYAWIAPVELVPAGEQPAVAASPENPGPVATYEPRRPDGGELAEKTSGHGSVPPLAPRPPFFRSRMALVAGCVAVFGLIALAVAMIAPGINRDHGRPASLQSAAPVVLVLPVSIGDGGENAWVALGVMDMVGQHLRLAGLPVVSSDSVVALSRKMSGDGGGSETIRAMADAASASVALKMRLEPSQRGWRAHLDIHAGTAPVIGLVAQGSDILDASREVAVQFVSLYAPNPGLAQETEAAGDGGLERSLQQVQSARLAGKADLAQALIESLSPADRQQPRVVAAMAGILLESGQYERARRMAAGLLDQREREFDPIFRANLLHTLARSEFRLGNHDAALGHAQTVITLLGQDPSAAASGVLGRALVLRGILSGFTEVQEADVSDFARARVLFEGSGDRLALANLYSIAGLSAYDQDRPHEAVPLLRSAIDQASRLDDVMSELRARMALAHSQLALLDPFAAKTEESRIAALRSRVADPAFGEWVDIVRGEILTANGEFTAARPLLQRACSDAVAQGYAELAAHGCLQLARWAYLNGDAPLAVETAQRALALPWPLADTRPRERALAFRLLLLAQLAAGDPRGAGSTLRSMEEWLDGDENPHKLYLSLARAEYASATDDALVASREFGTALAMADAERVPLALLRVCRSYMDELLSRKEIAKASAVGGRLAQWAEQHFDAALAQADLYRVMERTEQWRAMSVIAGGLAGERKIPMVAMASPVSVTATAIAQRRLPGLAVP